MMKRTISIPSESERKTASLIATFDDNTYLFRTMKGKYFTDRRSCGRDALTGEWITRHLYFPCSAKQAKDMLASKKQTIEIGLRK